VKQQLRKYITTAELIKKGVLPRLVEAAYSHPEEWSPQRKDHFHQGWIFAN
jgi:hypothetical protein